MANTRTRRNPTQADIIAVMVAQEVTRLQIKIGSALERREPTDELRAARDAVLALRTRIARYLDGDLTALYD